MTANAKDRVALEERAREFIRAHVDLAAAGITENEAIFFAAHAGIPEEGWPELFQKMRELKLAEVKHGNL